MLDDIFWTWPLNVRSICSFKFPSTFTAEIFLPDIQKCRSEFFNAERVDNGVHGWISMGQEDGDISDNHWCAASLTKQGDAVEGMKR